MQNLKKKLAKETNNCTVITGNRCGHDPDAPILNPDRSPPENLPRILQDAVERSRMFYSDPQRFPELINNRYSPRQSHHVHKQSDFTSRMIRSERREALSRVMALILSMVDLRTLRIGYTNWKDPGFVLPDSYWIAEKCNLGYDRTCRALRSLRDAGYVRTTERAEITADDGLLTTYRARTAVRTITMQFFTALGIKPARVKRERQAAYQRYLDRLRGHTANYFDRLYQTLAGKRRRAKIIEKRGEEQWRPRQRDEVEIALRMIEIQADNEAYFSALDPRIRQQRSREMAIAEMMGRPINIQ